MNIVIILFLIIGLVAIDQVLKMIVANMMQVGETLAVISGVFHITFVKNTGAAFSVLRDKQFFLISITFIVMLIVFVVLIKNRKKFSLALQTSLVMIIGGGIGNLTDRIRLGYVVDYLDVRLIHFPVFNFADCCIVIGVILLFLVILIEERREKKTGSQL